MPTVATNKRVEIVEAVDAKTAEIAEFLKRLIQFDSETGKEGPIQDFIAASLTKMGLEVDKWVPDLDELAKHPAYIPAKGRDFSGRPNVVGIYRGDPAARSLLFNGHVDTIPWTPVSDWQFDPLSGELEDGKILGRGSSDMKGGLAAMTMALKTLLDMEGLPLRSIDAGIISSVVPPAVFGIQKFFKAYYGTPALQVGPGIKTGMPIRIDNPYEVGADRLVNAVAAFDRFGSSCLVVDFGTGINFDVVSPAGEYLGGLVFYEFLYGTSAVGNKFRPEGMYAEYARFLQETAHRAVEGAK